MHKSGRSAGRFDIRSLAALVIAVAPTVHAGELSVRVLDSDGGGVPDVAIVAEALEGTARGDAAPATREPAVMEQVGSAFVPHILVIESGTNVNFPNNDSVSHHVYSFSDAKTFELELYRGSPHPPEPFEHAGLVVLGCNIHDSMLGFILVVDTPYFGKTAADGSVTLSGLPAGNYRIRAWTPRANERHLPPSQELQVGPSARHDVLFTFTTKLQRPHSIDPGSLEWKHY